MTAGGSFRTRALLSMQRALWGMVTPELRGVAISLGEDVVVRARMIYEREPSGDEREIASEVETFVLADFDPEVDVGVAAVASPPPAPLDLLPGEEWVYRRREAPQ